MKIFFPNGAIVFPPRNGAEIHRHEVIKGLVEQGHVVRTLQPDQNPLTWTDKRTPISVICALRWADAIYCRIVEKPNGATRLLSGPMRWFIRPATAVIWEFNISLEGASEQRGRTPREIADDIAQLRKSIRRVDAARGLGPGFVEQAKRLFDFDNVTTIGAGSDTERFRPDAPRPAGFSFDPSKLHIATVGASPNSYHDMRLIEDLATHIDQAKLPVMVHTFGQSASLVEQPHHDCLIQHGLVPYDAIPGWLAAMDVGLCLYNIPIDHNSPLKLFDFLASGCVPVCSGGTSMRSIIDGHDVGFVDDWTVQTLSDCLMSLHRDVDRRRDMARRGRNLVVEHHTWRRVAQRTGDLIEKAVKAKRRSP